MDNHYTILALGFAKWFGSDARALGQAFRKLGHSIIDLDEEDYVGWRSQGFKSKLIRRLAAGSWNADYNAAVLEQAAASCFDFVLVFKGSLLKPDTINKLRTAGKPIYNFYPDVSFVDHGPNIPPSLRLYDCVFTTKSFHGPREIAKFQIKVLRCLRHGFDPEIHRPIEVSPHLRVKYESDVSFVGCWSPEKEERILYLMTHASNLKVKVYGLGWHYASSEFRKRLGSNLKPGVFGDELAIVYRASKVNLGLLSSAKTDSSLRDQTTARSFQIPATRSFMLHEDTPEIRLFFEDGREVMLFSNNEQMVEKAQRAVNSLELRTAIRLAGYRRCQRDCYDYSTAAREIVRYFESDTTSSGDNQLADESRIRQLEAVINN